MTDSLNIPLPHKPGPLCIARSTLFLKNLRGIHVTERDYFLKKKFYDNKSYLDHQDSQGKK